MMKIRITPLIILFVLVGAACQRSSPVLEPKKFKVPRNEEQMLVWLKEQNCEVEKLSENRYSISWKEELPDGQITALMYGKNICKVLIKSTSDKNKNSKNTAYFTFLLSLGTNIDAIVSSNVELVQSYPQLIKLNPDLMPMYRYNYQIQSLQTSQNPVNVFEVFYSRNIPTHPRDPESLVKYPVNTPRPSWMEVENPSNLWENSTESLLKAFKLSVRDFKSTIWFAKNLGILPGESQQGFAIQLRSIPGIILAGVDIDNRKREGSEPIIKIDEKSLSKTDVRRLSRFSGSFQLGYSYLSVNGRNVDISGTEMVGKILLQNLPQGKIIGPEIIPADWDVSKLTQRLETLTSQSVAEGWLDQGAARQLKQYLTDSQTAFPEDRDKAKREIQKFAEALKEMEINVNLTQEAATLLGTNAAYLLTKF